MSTLGHVAVTQLVTQLATQQATQQATLRDTMPHSFATEWREAQDNRSPWPVDSAFIHHCRLLSRFVSSGLAWGNACTKLCAGRAVHKEGG